MGLDKAIAHGKEHRKSYRKAKSVSVDCRNHGACPYCRHTRTYHKRKTEEHSLRDISDYKKGDGFSDSDYEDIFLLTYDAFCKKYDLPFDEYAGIFY